jgi:hypothetical protein
VQIEHFPERGSYLVPGRLGDMATTERLHAEGPVAFSDARVRRRIDAGPHGTRSFAASMGAVDTCCWGSYHAGLHGRSDLAVLRG